MIRLPECPICGKSVAPASDPNGTFSPFCSRRCKEVDLVRWIDGRYAIVDSVDPERMVDLQAKQGHLDLEEGLDLE